METACPEIPKIAPRFQKQISVTSIIINTIEPKIYRFMPRYCKEGNRAPVATDAARLVAQDATPHPVIQSFKLPYKLTRFLSPGPKARNSKILLQLTESSAVLYKRQKQNISSKPSLPISD
jgi:hypothetical protein